MKLRFKSIKKALNLSHLWNRSARIFHRKRIRICHLLPSLPCLLSPTLPIKSSLLIAWWPRAQIPFCRKSRSYRKPELKTVVKVSNQLTSTREVRSNPSKKIYQVWMRSCWTFSLLRPTRLVPLFSNKVLLNKSTTLRPPMTRKLQIRR